ncbi:HSP20-like chaperone [Stipitochalara longipes BDJ]|nr:HSP20-like chaperone [Stipitochalara longipes BDJ]
MPFFRPAYLTPEASFFQLLSELDQPQQKQCAPRQHRAQTFTPRFDVTEVENAYELYGELPGLEQSDVTIEFSDAQTLVIKGKTERPSNKVEAAQPEATNDTTDSSSEKSHNPTVEDEYDEADTPLATPATTATVTAEEKQEQPAETQTPKPKYWVAERRVGSFARSFSFSQRIEHEAVEASLKNGILRVVVPKSQKTGKIAVNVL